LQSLSIPIDSIDAFVFDFDGVLTNNLVHLDCSGLTNLDTKIAL